MNAIGKNINTVICNSVQRKHDKKLNNRLPVLQQDTARLGLWAVFCTWQMERVYPRIFLQSIPIRKLDSYMLL